MKSAAMAITYASDKCIDIGVLKDCLKSNSKETCREFAVKCIYMNFDRIKLTPRMIKKFKYTLTETLVPGVFKNILLAALYATVNGNYKYLSTAISNIKALIKGGIPLFSKENKFFNCKLSVLKEALLKGILGYDCFADLMKNTYEQNKFAKQKLKRFIKNLILELKDLSLLEALHGKVLTKKEYLNLRINILTSII